MSERIAVLLIHADPATQSWVKDALPEDAFAVTVARRAEDARHQLPVLRPQVALVDMALVADDRALRETLLAQDPPCLLVALVNPGVSGARTLESGADDVITLPVADAVLRGKLRSGLRLVRRVLAAHGVRGEIGPQGPLGIIKHCEDHRLSGLLTIEGEGRSFSAEFFGGELMGTASHPPAAGGDDLVALLSLRAGCYIFVQAAVDPLAHPEAGEGAQTEPPVADAVEALAPPAPIVTKVKGSPPGTVYEVRTSGENRPRLALSTVILRDGAELRRMETSWPHPIISEADLAQAWAQMVHQHERVMAKLREVTDSLRRAPSTSGIDGTLLSWALHFVAEHAWANLGTTVTASLLRRTQRTLAFRWPHLTHFRVGERAQVTFDLSRGPTLVSDAVDAVAEWLVAFLSLAGQIAPNLEPLDVRQSTALMAAALEGVGFYEALARATARGDQSAVESEAAEPEAKASVDPAAGRAGAQPGLLAP